MLYYISKKIKMVKLFDPLLDYETLFLHPVDIMPINVNIYIGVQPGS